MKKIALVMSGAVSLGSFHAGVLAELLYALDSLRRQGRELQLDVITGASAGSITGALVAHAVMNDFGRRDGLHKAWVELVSIERLLKDPPENAFLSQEAVRDIARECIRPPYDVAGKASFAPAVLRLGFTLSNLNGINRCIETPGMPGGPHFDSTFFDDSRTYRLVESLDAPPDPAAERRRWNVQDPATWEDVAAFGIASGSFPLAFPPVSLERFPWEMVSLAPPLAAPRRYTYVDGGTFNNQPIAEAVGLSREADDGELHPDRLYLFVNAAAENEDLDEKVGPDSNLFHVGRRLAECIFAQSRTSDWIRSLLIDNQVTWRNDLFRELARIVGQTSVGDPAGLEASLASLAGRITEVKAAEPNARRPGASLEALLERTEHKFGEVLNGLPAGDGHRRRVLALLFLVLDNVADLEERKFIDIRIISPPPKGLAGEQLAWFGGFFKQEWREFDYRKGRLLAREHVRKIFGADYPPEAGAEEQYAIPDAWNDFPNQTLRDVPRKPRELLRDTILKRLEPLIESLRPVRFRPINAFVHHAVRDFARDRLNELLELAH